MPKQIHILIIWWDCSFSNCRIDPMWILHDISTSYIPQKTFDSGPIWIIIDSVIRIKFAEKAIDTIYYSSQFSQDIPCNWYGLLASYTFLWLNLCWIFDMAPGCDVWLAMLNNCWWTIKSSCKGVDKKQVTLAWTHYLFLMPFLR